MNIIKALLLASLAGFLIAACSSTPTTAPLTALAPSAAPASAPAPVNAAPPPISAAPAPVVPATRLPAHLDPKNALSTSRSIFFAFDDASFGSEYGPRIELHGKYLAANPALSIKIEGNADERGGSEYNLALGQKRAETVRRALKLYGVSDAQMEAISWGKEKPRALGHDDAAWAQNRRVDLIYRN